MEVPQSLQGMSASEWYELEMAAYNCAFHDTMERAALEGSEKKEALEEATEYFDKTWDAFGKVVDERLKNIGERYGPTND